MDTLEAIKVNEILLQEEGRWLHFSQPYRIFIARELHEVLPKLSEIERLVEANHWYAAGFLSYEAACAFDPAIHTLPGCEFPYLWFGLYPKPSAVRLPNPEEPKPILNWQPTVERESYHEAIAKIKELIAKGRTYQVNYTMRLQANFRGRAWPFFLHLAQHQNRHAAYVNTGRFVVCSASPELFFQLDGNTITCRPMKGTTKRGRTTVEDREQSEWLRNSEKNRAENVMIVDMIRNDLGRVAVTGSVSVPQLFETERYPTLWQMTSTIQAETHAPVADILTALFPCASITGAPKVSTMKIIAGLEKTPRKIYTGTIGHMAPGRKAKFNVAIRTLLIDQKLQKAEYGVGGGIVWDSNSMEEYAEALLKARLLTQQSRPFSLLETILWTPEEGFFLYERHISRVLDSAEYFDIPVTKQKIDKFLKQISLGLDAPQRVRVLIDESGSLSSELSSFDLSENLQPLKIALAKKPVDSRSVFLFHKTTQRDAYESAREGFEALDDVLLYNERGELTEFTIGNLVVELEGQFLTPPVSCGLLAGTFRAHLLETGQVVERTITVEQSAHCTKLFRVNSIRRWQEVEILR